MQSERTRAESVRPPTPRRRSIWSFASRHSRSKYRVDDVDNTVSTEVDNSLGVRRRDWKWDSDNVKGGSRFSGATERGGGDLARSTAGIESDRFGDFSDDACDSFNSRNGRNGDRTAAGDDEERPKDLPRWPIRGAGDGTGAGDCLGLGTGDSALPW